MAYADRVLRFIIASLIIGLYMSGKLTGVFGIVLLVIAAVFTITSLISSCPLYSILGFSTLKRPTETTS